MEVAIITVYNTENCGSALQAYALSEYVKELGYNQYFVYRSTLGTPNANWRCYLSCLKNILKFDYGRAKERLYRYKAFHKFQKRFVIKKINKISSNDIIIIGSDTLWNLEDDYFSKQKMFFWASEINCKKKFTYAIAVGNTNVEAFEDDWFKNQLESFDAMSARDKHTYEIIKRIYDEDIEIVCDPTLLYTKEKYRKMYNADVQEKYVLLYYFGELNTQQISQIKLFADERKFKIYSFGRKRNWCDNSISNSPENFLKYFDSAEFVVTNTFHGAVFSTIYEKQFIAFVENSIKAREYLLSIGLNDRIMNINSNNIINKLSSDIDYDIVNYKINNIREKSKKFIKKNIQ
ncbi:MAG: polysaccharide pyruvyl transferase family protein [Anaerostipes sp.]|jgi:hypothetical protein|nr:polysaccharide pyruvyl transferase family protein [Anaerostipes sp.]